LVGYKCGFTCAIRVVGWGCWFSYSSQLVLEIPFYHFLSTLICVEGKFASDAPLVCGCKASFCIDGFIYTLLFWAQSPSL